MSCGGCLAKELYPGGEIPTTFISDIGGWRLGLSSTYYKHEYSLHSPVVSNMTNSTLRSRHRTALWRGDNQQTATRPSLLSPLVYRLAVTIDCYAILGALNMSNRTLLSKNARWTGERGVHWSLTVSCI